MGSFFNHASFNLLPFKLQLLETAVKDEKIEVSRIDETFFNEEIDFSKDKETKILTLLQAAFEELSIKKALSSNAVSFTLPADLFLTANFPFEPALLDSDLFEDFRYRLSVLNPQLNLLEYVINFFECDSDEAAQRNYAFVFGLNRKFIKILHDFCQKNSLKLHFIDHSHLAAKNLLLNNSAIQNNISLSFFISSKNLSVLIADSRSIEYYENLPIVNFHEITSLVKDQIKFLTDHYSFDEAILFGDNISKTIADILSEEVSGIKFKLINTFVNLNVENSLLTTKYFSETNHLFASAAGASLRV